MQIREVAFSPVRCGNVFTKISDMSGLGWSPPIKLPAAVRVFGKVCEFISLSGYGAIRFILPGPDGRLEYLYGDSQVPMSMDNLTDGYMIVPWGEPQRLVGCGLSTKLYQVGSVIGIEFVTASRTDKHRKYLYQLEIDIKRPNVITVDYYHCVSGYATVVGVAGDPKDYAEWSTPESQPIMKKALEFITEAGIPVPEPTPEPEPIEPDPEPEHYPIPEPGRIPRWDTTYDWDDINFSYRIEEVGR